MTTLTALLDRPRVASTTPSMADRTAAVPAGAPGLAAALVVSGWVLFFDRRVPQPMVWSSIAAGLAFLALWWPVARRGWLRCAAMAVVELAILAAVIGPADRAIAAWEERAPRFVAASTVAAGALDRLGYQAAAEDGLLLLDHPDGLVTVVPSMEKLGARPLLLFGAAWVALWLVRDSRRAAAAAVVGLAALLAVGMLRYVVLLLIYVEHDDILSGVNGLVALDRFASPWIAIGFLVLAGLALPAVVLGLAGSWGGMRASESLHRRVSAWPEPRARVDEVTFLWQGGACAFPPVLGTPDSVPLDRSYDTLLVAVHRLGLVPRVAYTYDEDLLGASTRAVVVVAPVNAPPPGTLARLRGFVRDGGSLIVMDDSRIGERGGARAFLDQFDASIVYHGPQGPDGVEKPHVHVGGMEPVAVPSGAAFACRKASGRGQVVSIWDAADFSRNGLGHCFARPWKSARARYEAISSVLRDVLRIVPDDRRFCGVL